MGIVEMSGAVLASLNKAKELGENLLVREAEELVKEATEQKLAYASEASLPDPISMLLLLPARQQAATLSVGSASTAKSLCVPSGASSPKEITGIYARVPA